MDLMMKASIDSLAFATDRSMCVETVAINLVNETVSMGIMLDKPGTKKEYWVKNPRIGINIRCEQTKQHYQVDIYCSAKALILSKALMHMHNNTPAKDIAKELEDLVEELALKDFAD